MLVVATGKASCCWPSCGGDGDESDDGYGGGGSSDGDGGGDGFVWLCTDWLT